MGKGQPIVSIIIPLYNMQKYIDECIQSILLQTFENWELLLVDDGSTDDTLKICYFYAKKDYRVKVIHQENAGVSVARNAGLQSAIGTYIVFADGDDLLTPDSLKCRVELMQQSDMGIAGYESFGANGTEKKMPRCTRQIWNRKDAIENTLLAGEIGYQGYLWNKIFSRACILDNDIRFREGIAYNEDRLFVVQYVMHCKRVRLADTVVYRYRNNPDGAMGSLTNMTDGKYDKIMSEFEAFEMMCKMMKEYDKDLYDRCAVNAMTRAIGLNKMINKEQRRLKHDMGRKIREYGLVAIRGGGTDKEKNQDFCPYTISKIKENLLTVIIPVYNAEKTLKCCVESVIDQTYQNLELLLVDDGSTDSSPGLCDKLSEMDDRIRVFHIENSGPSEARNEGLLHMRGQYLAFVDADDYLESDMYEIMIREIKKEHVQMAVCNWKIHITDSNICTDSDIGNCGRIKAEILRRVIASEDIIGGGGYPWNRVIDWKSVLENGNQHMLFPRGVNVYEDKIWMIRILNCMQDVTLLPDVKYHYMVREGSLSHRKASDRLWDYIQAWKLIEQEFEYQLPIDAITKREVQTLNMLWSITKEKKINLLRKAWPECADIVKSGARSVKNRIKYWIMRGLVVGAYN